MKEEESENNEESNVCRIDINIINNVIIIMIMCVMVIYEES
jgi:hypothetical protein